MWAIIKKEFKSTFFSPVGYIVIAMFLIIFSALFYVFSINNRSVDLSSIYYGTSIYGLPIITAVLTMKSFAEERSKDTEQLLFMSPRSTVSIVMGKFFAILAVIGVALVLSFIYYVLLLQCGIPSIKLVLITILGFILLSMAYISFGLLASSITESQVIAAIITLVFLMLPLFASFGDGIFSYLSLIDLFIKFSSGVISAKEVIGLLSFTVMCITLVVIIIKRRKKEG
ncbi:MAG: ABC transporter permease subunit [Clostridia bacterium]|nr:ABC transporter permease subunit [Clostridia bacterium]